MRGIGFGFGECGRSQRCGASASAGEANFSAMRGIGFGFGFGGIFLSWGIMKFIENKIEVLIFGSRWLLAPLYLGIILGIMMIGVKFFQEMIHYVPLVVTLETPILTNVVLELVDLILTANLLLIFLFSGYENFISKIGTADFHEGVAAGKAEELLAKYPSN